MRAARSRGLTRRMTGSAGRRRLPDRVARAIDRALARAPGCAADDWDRCRRRGARAALLDRAADLFEADRAAAHGADGARGRQDAGRMPWAICARRSIFCATTPPKRSGEFAAPRRAQGTDRRAAMSSALHGRGVFACDLALELPAGDLHRPDRRRARRGQCRAGQAGRADAADRRPRHQAAASGRRSADVLHLLPGDGETVGAALVGDPAHRRRRVHRLAPTPRIAINRALAAARWRDRPAHRRDRRA